MEKFFTLALLLFIISCKSISESEMREKAKQGIIEYFHQKYQALIIDSLHVANVEPVRQGRVVYKAQYSIKTTDKSDKDVTIKIAINKNDVVYMDKNFHVIDEQ
jgi:hypothetical protein